MEIVDPTVITGWDEMLGHNEAGDFFHSSAWARVLVESYGYAPSYFFSSERSNLTFLMPFMDVSSPITGRRGVSLPWTDR